MKFKRSAPKNRHHLRLQRRQLKQKLAPLHCLDASFPPRFSVLVQRRVKKRREESFAFSPTNDQSDNLTRLERNLNPTSVGRSTFFSKLSNSRRKSSDLRTVCREVSNIFLVGQKSLSTKITLLYYTFYIYNSK